jgi:Flp pilus assembly protein TadD
MLSFKGGMPQARTLLATIRESFGDRLGDADRRKVLKLQARLAMSGGAGDDEAVKVLTEVIEADPLDGEALMLLGQHHGRKGEPDQAILMYERAARVEGFAAQAKVKIAQIYVSQSRFSDALPLLRDAQALKPREDVARYIEQVERASRAKR